MKVQLFFSAALLLLLLPLFFDVAFAAGHSSSVGGWIDRNPKDKDVVDAAEYAVNEHDQRTHQDLKYKHVAFAQSQKVGTGGTNYRLLIVVSNGKVEHNLVGLGHVYAEPAIGMTELKDFKRIIE